MDVVVTWRDASMVLPDAETTVLVCDSSGEVHAGFHDGDDGWRDAATADRMTESVMFWTDYPMSPMEAAEREAAQAGNFEGNAPVLARKPAPSDSDP